MAMTKKVGAIIQARCNSTRLKDKVLYSVNNLSLIEFLVKRLSKSKKIHEIIVATTKDKSDDDLVKLLKKKKIKFFRGDINNVLKRYFDASKKFGLDTIIRVTGDCPLIDCKIVDKFIDSFHNQKNKIDLLYEGEKLTFPDGIGVEIFSKKTLKLALKKVKTNYDKEHVTTLIKKSKSFSKKSFSNDKDLSNYRFTVDEIDDFKNFNRIVDFFWPNIHFSLSEIIVNIKNKKIKLINNNIKRDEGSKMNTGQKLWRRAKQLIPGGNMLISKRPNLYLPNRWPTYYKKARGCFIWDLDNIKYIDFSMMGVGTNILGYSNPKVNRRVKLAVDNGNMSTFNCREEVDLAEKILKMHSWAEQAKFARTGGEVNAIAIRLARAFTNKTKIAICGYHGWHDWYLSTNLNNKNNLNSNLMGDLEIQGVPKKLKNTVFPFIYNDLNSLKKILRKNDIGVIIMEVSRNYKPVKQFLQKIRKLCDQKKIVLIFDECTSGFRETFGGLHLKYKVNPDICMFGKALGNGFPITCIIGKKAIMSKANRSFISSTFWSDRSGPASALETLNFMEKNKTWKKITKFGLNLKSRWKKLGNKHNLPIEIFGMNSIPSFQIISQNSLKYKTFITQEMLKRKILSSNTVFVSIAHNNGIMKKYISELDKIFLKIKRCEKKELNIDDLLEGPVSESSFKRLN